MADLKKYLPEEAMHAVSAIRKTLHLGTHDPKQLNETLGTCTFRDTSGTYFCVGIRSKQWYRFDAGKWSRSDKPLDRMEGDAVVDSFLNHQVPGTPSAQPIGPTLTDPVATFVDLVTRWGKAYHLGRFDSNTVEDAIRDIVLMDKQGQFWTIGLQSGQWYVFVQSRWHKTPGPPEASDLFETLQAPPTCPSCNRTISGDKFCRYCGQPVPRVRATIPDALDHAVFDFLEHGWEALPEPITSTWNPPADFPERPVLCSFCGMVHVEEVPECDRCGTALGDPKPAPSCTRCGSDLVQGAKFCRQCGHPVQAPPAEPDIQKTQICPNPECGKIVPTGKKFCTSCGTRVQLQ